MKKNLILITLLISFIFILGIPQAHARNYTEYLPNPYMYQVVPKVSGPTKTLIASYGTCRAQDAGVMFYHFKTIPEDAYSFDDAVVTAELYEDDPPSYEPDEYIKEYRLVYFSRELSDILIDVRMESGNIDSSGDPECELYMKFFMSGDIKKPFNRQIFEYRMFME